MSPRLCDSTRRVRPEPRRSAASPCSGVSLRDRGHRRTQADGGGARTAPARSVHRLARWLIVGVIVVLGLGPAAAADAPTLQLAKASERTKLAPFLRYNLSPPGDTSAAEALALARAGAMSALPGEREANFGFIDDDLWLYARVRAESGSEPQAYRLELGYPMIGRATLYLPRSDGSFSVQRAGTDVPRTQWPQNTRFPVFSVSMEPGQSRELLLRIRTGGPSKAPLSLATSSAHAQLITDEARIFSLYYGFLVALGLYNLLLYASLRERRYLHYVMMLATFGAFALCLNGHVYQYLWPTTVALSKWVMLITSALAAIMVIQFGRSFLELREQLPRFDRTLVALQIAWVVNAAGYVAIRYGTLMWAMNVMVVLTAVLTLAAGIWCLVRGVRQAGFYVLAWTLFLIGAVAFGFQQMGLLPGAWYTFYSNQMGSALEMILLSLALADRLRRREQENRRTLRESQDQLRRRVAERTVELQTAVDELANANRHLRELNLIDPLTRIENRRSMEERLHIAAATSGSGDAASTLILADLDGFKALNDDHGHGAGDTVLVHIAARLREIATARGGTAARYGGEEFIVLLAGTDLDSAESVAAEIVQEIATLEIPDHPQLQGRITASLGVSTVAAPETGAQPIDVDGWIERADQALYEVKARGGNGYRVG